MILLDQDKVQPRKLNVFVEWVYLGIRHFWDWMPAEYFGPPAKKQKKTIGERLGKWVNSIFGQEKESKSSMPVPFEPLESRFKILRQLGEGEFAKVMLAQCPKTNRLVCNYTIFICGLTSVSWRLRLSASMRKILWTPCQRSPEFKKRSDYIQYIPQHEKFALNFPLAIDPSEYRQTPRIFPTSGQDCCRHGFYQRRRTL